MDVKSQKNDFKYMIINNLNNIILFYFQSFFLK